MKQIIGFSNKKILYGGVRYGDIVNKNRLPDIQESCKYLHVLSNNKYDKEFNDLIIGEPVKYEFSYGKELSKSKLTIPSEDIKRAIISYLSNLSKEDFEYTMGRYKGLSFRGLNKEDRINLIAGERIFSMGCNCNNDVDVYEAMCRLNINLQELNEEFVKHTGYTHYVKKRLATEIYYVLGSSKLGEIKDEGVH